MQLAKQGVRMAITSNDQTALERVADEIKHLFVTYVQNLRAGFREVILE